MILCMICKTEVWIRRNTALLNGNDIDAGSVQKL